MVDRPCEQGRAGASGMRGGSFMLTACLSLLLLAGQAPAEAPTPADPPAPGETQPAEEPASRRVLRVAVYDLEAETIPQRVAAVFTESMLFELRKLERTNVVSFEEIRRMLDLEAEKAAMGCDEENSCLAEIADALGADALLAGSLARVGDNHVITLKRIDQSEATAAQSFNKVLPAGSGEELLAEVGPAIEQLFPEVPLRPGQTRGVSKDVARRIVPPPIPAWAFWTGIGTSSVLLAGASVAGGAQLLFYGQYQGLIDRAGTEPVSGRTLKETGELAQTSEIVGWSLLGAGLVAGTATAAMGLLTDFEGLGAEVGE
jgi:hypothetical protein